MWPTVYLCHDRTAAFPQRSEFLPASRSAKSNNIYYSRNMSFIHESTFRGRICKSNLFNADGRSVMSRTRTCREKDRVGFYQFLQMNSSHTLQAISFLFPPESPDRWDTAASGLQTQTYMSVSGGNHHLIRNIDLPRESHEWLYPQSVLACSRIRSITLKLNGS